MESILKKEVIRTIKNFKYYCPYCFRGRKFKFERVSNEIYKGWHNKKCKPLYFIKNDLYKVILNKMEV